MFKKLVPKDNDDIFQFILDEQIDQKKTVENGKEVCREYKPYLLQRRIAKMRDPVHSGSLIQVSNDLKTGNSTEHEIMQRLSWQGDQLYRFELMIDDLTKIDYNAGRFLYYKYLYDFPDDEIAKKLGISGRNLYRIKPYAYKFVAGWSHQIEYIQDKAYVFSFQYPGLYKMLG